MRLPPLHGLDVDRVLHDARGPTLLVLTKPGCGACRAVRGALAELPAIDGLSAWEVDAASAPGLVDELGVYHLPAVWLFREGEPVAEVAAEPLPGRLLAALEAALARAP